MGIDEQLCRYLACCGRMSFLGAVEQHHRLPSQDTAQLIQVDDLKAEFSPRIRDLPLF